MYVITFYSFKGGVGRTMALVNVGAELARRGRRVLLVDFDLEAPGLETYKRLRPKEPHPGIVEYVTEFRRTQEVPDVCEYLYEVKPIGEKGGRLWVMPAGRRDPAYRNALTDLDWKRLYQDEGGFILFEDTKKGWEKELNPDYVLIDSRTGDTDVLGICTRQLPDAVVLMFMPNKQNLAGLKNVVRDIRREETEGLKKKIQLHFVAANVPRLDDEKGILRKQLKDFGECLGFEKPSAKIRRYESLDLLDQSVFTLKRPKTSLARSYRRLLRPLLKENITERDAERWSQIDRIRDASRRWPDSVLDSASVQVRLPSSDEDLPMIEQRCRLKAEAARFAARRHRRLKAGDDSFAEFESEYRDLIGRAKALPDCFLWMCRNESKRGSDLKQYDDLAGCYENAAIAVDVVRRLITFGKAEPADLKKALNLTAEAQSALWKAASTINRFPDWDQLKLYDWLKEAGLKHRVWFDHYMTRSDPADPAAWAELQNRIMEFDARPTIQLLAQRNWRKAIEVSSQRKKFFNRRSQALAFFHQALAYWGMIGELPEYLCRQVWTLKDASNSWEFDASTCQALALVCWRLGERQHAREYVEKARRVTGPEKFSYWRCVEASVEEFDEDNRQIERLIDGEPLQPLFLAGSSRPESVESNTA